MTAGVERELSRVVDVEVRCVETFAPTGDGGRPSGTYSPGPPAVISLLIEQCEWISESLTRPRPGKYGWYEMSWHTLAHEYAHHKGYDHGERTVGADCVAERKLDRRLMRRAGMSIRLVRAIDRSVNRLDCAPSSQHG